MITTFYSYKGGVGRSMAMANVANILAHRGVELAMIDFDLEAPGLEEYFDVDHSEFRSNQGLMDLVHAYKRAVSSSGSRSELDRTLDGLDDYLQPVLPSVAGRLDILTAGRRGERDLHAYSRSLRSFDWESFYADWGGEAFFDWLKDALLDRYQLVLVDSRTGLSEMGGICSYQLADAVVLLSAANRQNSRGTRDMLRDLSSPDVIRRLRRDPPVTLVVPARVDNREPELLADFQEGFERNFAQHFPEQLRRVGLSYRDLQVPYEPSLAFNERVLRVDPQTGPQQRIQESFSNLADGILALADPDSSLGRLSDRLREDRFPDLEYNATFPIAPWDVFVSARMADDQFGPLLEGLREHGLVIWSEEQFSPGTRVSTAIGEAIRRSLAGLIVVDGRVRPTQTPELELLIERRENDPDFPLVLLFSADADPADPPPFMGSLPFVDARSGLTPAVVSEVVAALRSPAPRARPTVDSRSPFPGFAPFTEADTGNFFGRDADVRSVLAELSRTARLLVIGPAGVGKTSFLRAGLIPELAHRGFTVIADEPDRELIGRLRQRLATVEQPIVVLDDLELLFQDEDSDLAEALAAELDSPLLRKVPVIAAIRSDGSRAVAESSLGRALDGAQFYLHALDRAALREAIVGPLRREGVAIEDGLVDRIVTDAVAAGSDSVSLVQPLLAQLFTERRSGFITHRSYDEIGGLQGAVSFYAERAFTEISATDDRAARELILSLVRIDPYGRSTRGTRSFAAIPASQRPVVDHLLDARLLTATQDGVTLSSEALLVSWPRLAGWVAEDRERLRLRSRLAHRAAEWASEGEAHALLAHGDELSSWVDAVPAHSLDPLVANYLGESRRSERQRQLRLALALFVLVLSVLALAIVLFTLFLSGS